MYSPDPQVNASVFCAGRLDELLGRVLAPLWRDLAQHLPGCDQYIWFVRYRRRGEHLKIRWHGPAEAADLVRRLLAESVEQYFSSIGSSPLEVERRIDPRAPPLDAEDEKDGTHPDCMLVWTEHRRSPFLFGSPRHASDDWLMDLFTRAAGAVGAIVLMELAPNVAHTSYRSYRQSLFLKLLLVGFAGLGLTWSELGAYLAYHRDWIIRYLVAKGEVRITPQVLLGNLDSVIAPMSSKVEGLSTLLLDGHGAQESVLFARWRASLEAFLRYVKAYRENTDYNVDPHTRDYAFPPLFKLLGLAANQFGFRLTNEAYIYHLLARAWALGETGEGSGIRWRKGITADLSGY